jgi:alpha 1,3-glucosidase
MNEPAIFNYYSGENGSNAILKSS